MNCPELPILSGRSGIVFSLHALLQADFLFAWYNKLPSPASHSYKPFASQRRLGVKKRNRQAVHLGENEHAIHYLRSRRYWRWYWGTFIPTWPRGHSDLPGRTSERHSAPRADPQNSRRHPSAENLGRWPFHQRSALPIKMWSC